MHKVIQNDIIIYRIILTIFLIIYHSFAMFDGKWIYPSLYIGDNNISIYKWVARSSYGIMLEGFVFISGYLFAIRFIKNKLLRIRSVVRDKFHRLIVPSIFFSCIYMFLFNEYKDFTLWEYILGILNGVGHLWFLPMLFWCFFFGNILCKYAKRPLFILSFTFLLPIISDVYTIPCGITISFKYLFYFMLGFYVYIYKSFVLNNLVKIKYILWIFFLVFFFFCTYYYIKSFFLFYDTDKNILLKGFSFFLSSVYKILGVLGLYLGLNFYLKRNNQISVYLYNLSNYLFGVYVFHQMILEYLYYHTSIPAYIDIVCLPFVGMIITSIFSVILSWGILKTKLGKNLL